ncbi:MAG: type II toxin-antitoxin system VapC family toxin [Verrucomicrobiales bacterium]|nr:type II toxin-antitoxin system VapC family toxin [Verrucomicrobiales bacterium]
MVSKPRSEAGPVRLSRAIRGGITRNHPRDLWKIVTCADTSFLFSLYGNDAHSPRVLAWMKSQRSALTVTALGEYELGNALRFSEFRRGIAPGEAAMFWAQFEADRASGRLQLHVCNLADVVEEAKRLSSTYTLTGGHRGFDILHVAAALNLKAQQLLTFDENQKKLAEAEGLIVPI